MTRRVHLKHILYVKSKEIVIVPHPLTSHNRIAESQQQKSKSKIFFFYKCCVHKIITIFNINVVIKNVSLVKSGRASVGLSAISNLRWSRYMNLNLAYFSRY